MAAPPGRDTTVSLFNTPAGATTGLWSNFSAPITPRPVDATSGGARRIALQIPADAHPGVYALRVATTTGPSKLQLLMIDDLETIQSDRRNTTPATAQPITPPIAIEGSCQPLTSDYYRLTARRGQRIAFETVARRLGSRMDPVIRILDSAGREILVVDDTPALSGDFRFAHTFDADGEYTLELRDAEYFGGADRRYRLRVGDFPVATVAFPLAGRRGASARFEFAGPDVNETLGPVELKLPADRLQTSFGLKSPGGVTSAMISVLCDPNADFVAPTPNESRETAAPIALPINISGRFARPGNRRHFYAFDAKRGDKVSLRGQTRSLGSPCTLALEILKPDGSTLAESKPAEADDGLLDAAVPTDGKYLIAVSELTGAGGPAFAYRLSATRSAPGFSLAVESDRLAAAAGGAAKLKIKCVRQGYDGPIQLGLDGAATGWELRNATIAKDKKEIDVEIVVPATAKPGPPLLLRLVGTATLGDTRITEVVSTAEALKATFPKLTLAMPDLDGWIALGITPAADAAKTR